MENYAEFLETEAITDKKNTMRQVTEKDYPVTKKLLEL